MHPIMDALFQKHVASSLDKQLHLQELVGEEPRWQLDMETGRISFGARYSFAIQALGTESALDGTWLWAWANEASDIPERLLESARALKRFGEEKQVPELTQPLLTVGELDGHKLSMIASGACRADAYYRGPYEGGAVFVLIQDTSFPAGDENTIWRIASTFTQVLANFPVNHRKAFVEYLHYYGLKGKCDGLSITVQGPEGRVLKTEFDEAGRLLKLGGDVGAPPEKKKRRRRRTRRRRP
jgi:hypothetical protein